MVQLQVRHGTEWFLTIILYHIKAARTELEDIVQLSLSLQYFQYHAKDRTALFGMALCAPVAKTWSGIHKSGLENFKCSVPTWLQDVDVRYVVGAPAVGQPPRPVIVELQLAEGIQLQLLPVIGPSRDVPHDHSGGVDQHHEVGRVLHCVGLSAEDVGDLEKRETNTL